MSPLAHHFYTMALNNAWANHRLLGACARLSPADFTARRTSFFPSIVATANHLLTVDWFYVDALERAHRGQPVNADARRFFEPEVPFLACVDVQREQRAVDQRLIAFCRTVEDLERPVPIQRAHGPVEETTTRMLAHLFEHQIHHRGQIHAMLAGTSVPPPQLDEFFCAGDAPLRAADLAELGLSEEDIWVNPR